MPWICGQLSLVLTSAIGLGRIETHPIVDIGSLDTCVLFEVALRCILVIIAVYLAFQIRQHVQILGLRQLGFHG
jgi:hypothetical protein